MPDPQQHHKNRRNNKPQADWPIGDWIKDRPRLIIFPALIFVWVVIVPSVSGSSEPIGTAMLDQMWVLLGFCVLVAVLCILRPIRWAVRKILIGDGTKSKWETKPNYVGLDKAEQKEVKPWLTSIRKGCISQGLTRSYIDKHGREQEEPPAPRWVQKHPRGYLVAYHPFAGLSTDQLGASLPSLQPHVRVELIDAGDVGSIPGQLRGVIFAVRDPLAGRTEAHDADPFGESWV